MDFVSTVLDLGRPSKVYNDQDADVAAKCAEIAKDTMHGRVRSMIAQAAGRPVLVSYSCDGTPIRACKYFNERKADGSWMRRAGGAETEFLLQRAWLKTGSLLGPEITAPMVGEPLAMNYGKSAFAHFCAADAFMPTRVGLKHSGICVQHLTCDRGIHGPLARYMRGRALQPYVAGSPPIVPAARAFDWLQDWSLDSPCANHSAHNALKWSLDPLIEKMDAAMKDFFLVVDGLRGGFDLLMSHMARFVMEKLVLEPKHGFEGDRNEFWSLLGVDASMLEEFSTLDPRWDGVYLYVNVDVDPKSVVQRVVSLLTYAFRFRRFSDSRWLTIGATSRSVCLGVAVGLDGLVADVRADVKASDYHMHQYERLSPELRRFAMVATVASLVPDALLQELLQDDRLCRRCLELQEVVTSEMEYIASLGQTTWERLYGLMPSTKSAIALRSDVLLASATAASYMNRHIFDGLRHYPWTLAQGDILHNLHTLSAGPRPTEVVAGKIYDLLKLGFNEQRLMEAVSLFRDCQCTSAQVEQLHGQVAAQHRAHSMLQPLALSGRSLLRSLVPLFLPKDAEAEALAKKEKRLQVLSDRQVRPVGARQAFFKDLVARVQNDAGSRGVRSAAEARHVMRLQAHLWNTFSLEVKASYEADATALTESKRQQLRDTYDALRAEALLLTRRREELRCTEGLRLRFASCPFSGDDMRQMQAKFEGTVYSNAMVKEKRLSLGEMCKPPDSAVQARIERLASMASGVAPPSTSKPAWLRQVCAARDSLTSAVLEFCGVGEDGVDKHYLFLYATKNPLAVAMLPLVEVESPSAEMSVEHYLEAPAIRLGRWFRVSYADALLMPLVQPGDCADVRVLLFAQLSGSDTVLLNSVAEPLATFAPSADEVAAQPRPAATAARAGQKDLLEMYPWLRATLQKENGTRPDRSGDPTAGHSVTAAPDDLDDEMLDKVFEALHQKRKEWAAEGGPNGENFRTLIRGGAWTMRNLGMSINEIRAEAARAEVAAWCVHCTLPKSATFRIARYGELQAKALARAWAHKMEFLFALWQEASTAGVKPTAEDMRVYEEPPELEAMVAEGADRFLCERVRDIRELRLADEAVGRVENAV